jgi:hypothetical protein
LVEHGLFDDLVRPPQHRRRDREAERLGGFEVDDQLELRRLLDWQVGGPGLVTDVLRRALTDARVDVAVLNEAPQEWLQNDVIADVVIVLTALTELAAWGRDLLAAIRR